MSRLSVVEKAKYVAISGGVFNLTNNHRSNGLHILFQASAPEASFDSHHSEPFAQCHPDTRVTVLRKIRSWITAPVSNNILDLSILWLTGAAGAGKSSIAATVCQELQDEGRLLANFFFSQRNGCTNSKQLFITIASQMSVSIPETRQLIDELVDRNPAIVTKALGVQLSQLIVQPLLQREPSNVPIFIVVDGLDECDGEKAQCDIISLLACIGQQTGRPVHILIASRPESWIQDEFSSEDISPLLYKLSLNHNRESDDDIRLYLRSNFGRIRGSRQHRHSMGGAPPDWPSQHVYDTLVERAGGMFVYPSTVVRFVDDPNFSPIERLKGILLGASSTHGLTSSSTPMVHLDQLYTAVLSSSVDPQRTLPILLAFTLVLNSRLCKREVLDVTEELLELGRGGGHRALRSLHSLLYIPESIADVRDQVDIEQYRNLLEGESPRFYHKSFMDFMLDKERCQAFYVQPDRIHSQLAVGCVKTLMDFRFQADSRLSWLTWSYAFRSWAKHCSMSALTDDLLSHLQSFSPLLCCIPRSFTAIDQKYAKYDAIGAALRRDNDLNSKKSDVTKTKFRHPDQDDISLAYCLYIIVHLGNASIRLDDDAKKVAKWIEAQWTQPSRFRKDLHSLKEINNISYEDQFKLFMTYRDKLEPRCWNPSSLPGRYGEWLSPDPHEFMEIPKHRMLYPMPPHPDREVVSLFVGEGVDHIMTNLRGGIASSKIITQLTALYTTSYNYCTSIPLDRESSSPTGLGYRLGAARLGGYHLYEVVKARLRQIVEGICMRASMFRGSELLVLYAQEWSCYSAGASYLNKPFSYINRDYVRRERDEGRWGAHNMSNLALVVWKVILLEPEGPATIRPYVVQAILQVLHDRRNGGLVDIGPMNQVIGSFAIVDAVIQSKESTPLDFYRRYLEDPLADGTLNFYRARAMQSLSSIGIIEYLRQVELLLQQEAGWYEPCVPSSTKTRLGATLTSAMVLEHMQLLQNSFKELYNLGGDAQGLGRLCRILSSSTEQFTLIPVYGALEGHVKEVVLAAISEASRGKVQLDSSGRGGIDSSVILFAVLGVHRQHSEHIARQLGGEYGLLECLNNVCKLILRTLAQ